METLLQLDLKFFQLINSSWTNSAFDLILPYWRSKYTWIPLYLMLCYLIYRQKKMEGLKIILVIILVVAFADFISSECIKKFFERLRPCNDDLVEFRLLLPNCGSGFSFTSSHACNHFALVVAIFTFMYNEFRGGRILILFLWATIIAYAQVYVGVHYPFDVISGAIIGSIVALICCKLMLHIKIIKPLI